MISLKRSQLMKKANNENAYLWNIIDFLKGQSQPWLDNQTWAPWKLAKVPIEAILIFLTLKEEVSEQPRLLESKMETKEGESQVSKTPNPRCLTALWTTHSEDKQKTACNAPWTDIWTVNHYRHENVQLDCSHISCLLE